MERDGTPEGFIHALLLDGRGGAAQVNWAAVTDWEPSAGTLWLHLDFGQEAACRWLGEHSGLNDIAVSALLSDETRPRTLHRGDTLLLALRGINLGAASDPEDMISLRIWTDGHRVISTRLRALASTDDLVEELHAGTGPVDTAGLIISWIGHIIARMSDTIEDFEDQVLELEEAVLSDQTDGVRAKLAHLRKQTISIRRYLAPQREALNRLGMENFAWMDEMQRIRLREITDRLIRYIEDIDEVRDRASLAMEELASRVAEQMNERTYVFTVVATIFLPLGFFTGLMGINVGGMPGVEDRDAFWIVVGLCLLVTLALGLFFRVKKWL